MATPPLADLRALWDRRIATNNTDAAVQTLLAWTIRDQGALDAVNHLIGTLTHTPGTVAEGGAWFRTLAAWSNGFPPDPAFTPLGRYPFDPTVGPAPAARFDPITGEPR